MKHLSCGTLCSVTGPWRNIFSGICVMPQLTVSSVNRKAAS